MRSSSSMDHTITHCHNVTVIATLAYSTGSATSITTNSIQSPPSFVLSIKAIVCRTIPVKCKLSIRRLRCYRPVHSRAVDKRITSHGPSSEAIAPVPQDQVTMTRHPQSANKQPFYCPRGCHRSNSVRFLLRSTTYDAHNWLNLNRRSTNSPVTDCGDDYLSGDTHMLGGISKTVMVRAS